MTLDERLTMLSPMMQVSRPSSTLLIGLGNPILGDDGVGWKIVQAVEAVLADDPRFQVPFRPVDSKVIHHHRSVEVDYLSLGGLALMERILGYGRVILVDSMETGQYPVGSVTTFSLADLPDPSAGHSASAHDTSLMTALQTAQAIGADIPERVDVVAVEARNAYEFTDELTPAIAQALSVGVQFVLDLLNG